MIKFNIHFFILLIFAFSTTKAQDSSQVVLAQVLVIEGRIDLPFSKISRNINIISKEQIQAAPVQSISELLSYVSGVDIRQRGAHGVQADVSIRGGTFDQTLVLVNGIKMSDPQTGHHMLNLPIDLEMIERIEIIKGPAARIYGQNAFSGAINIVTKVPEANNESKKKNAIFVEGSYGNYNLINLKAGVFHHAKKFDQYFSFSKNSSDGYKYNTDYNITNLFYQNQFSFLNQKFNLLGTHTKRKFGANGFYASPDFMDQYEETETSLLALNMKLVKNKFVLKPQIYWRRNKDEYLFLRHDPEFFHNIHTNHILGLNINSSLSSTLGLTGMGVELRSVELKSNNLGDHKRIESSFFIEQRFTFFGNDLDITPGISLNYYSDFGTNLFPGIDVGYRINRNIKAFANVGYTYRIPTFTDLYYNGPSNIGNENLEAESALSYEAGLKYNTAWMSVQTSWFLRQGQNLIDWTKESEADQWQPQNFNEVSFSGADLSFNFFPYKSGNRNLSFLRNIQIAYTYIDAAIQLDEAILSRYALENLKHQFIAKLDYRIFKRLHHNISYRYIDRANAALGNYQILDTKLMVKFNWFSTFVVVNNIFDETYKETNLVTMPGRWISFGAKFKLGF